MLEDSDTDTWTHIDEQNTGIKGLARKKRDFFITECRLSRTLSN